ncbi:L-aspartate oxidase [Hyphomonas johnsonii]|uniref:L-aspartate oxidase n=1 Tax=Hyphomonas johnsonii MHS-2 TaxID=1280950 RepID=A0A059FJJ0_9PROT|nr:L-aspartate oxidase [Hyphomonas johnsonii]KCZ90830.1 L-aspartate oxidase [Hyphomonas johnsonii MHS-2]
MTGYPDTVTTAGIQTLTATGAPESDVLIVGAGLAGLFLALELAPRPCLVISPAPLGQAASSAWAQGGLAAALDPLDSAEQHATDTVNAGAGLVDPVIARLIAEEGPARVRDLVQLGVPFDRTPDGALALSLEAAHSRPRVARVAGDLAGKAIMDALVAAVAAANHIRVIEGVRAVALLQDDTLRVGGVVLRDQAGRLTTCTARETVLCTGGTGGLFQVTTNPREARGDAIAMAYEAGALLADVEFVQFHPTAIDIGRDPAPLATEALRGEGATLRNTDGTRFMANYHTLEELAPRDEVARAIHSERAAGRGAFLDCRTAVGNHFPDHFPTVFSACKSAGIDPRFDMIPIAPAAHYHMGGIVADFWGASTLDGLSVCGECTSTGAHGANRLASNSLLEAVVFSHRIAGRLRNAALDAAIATRGTVPASLPHDALQALRAGMSKQCGVVRNAAGLDTLLSDIDALKATHGPARPLITAGLMATAALARTESRGGHFRSDFPETNAPERQFLIRAFDDPAEKVAST